MDTYINRIFSMLGNIVPILLIYSLANGVHGVTPEEELALSYGNHDFVSIATGLSQPLSAAPAAATVITADDIRRMGAIDLNQVLETVPGLHVGVSSLRFSPVYSIRGIHTERNPQVLVLVNGTPITQAFQGDRGVNFNLPVEAIRRIEIIRGPGSAVYGADAFSGVIDIITKNGSDYQGVETGVRGGSFDTAAAWGLYGGKLNNIDVSLSIEGSTTNGDSGRTTSTDAQSVFDLSGTSASRAPGAFSTGADQVNTRIDLGTQDWFARFWNWRQMNLGVGPGLTQALDPSGYAEVDNYLLEAGLHEQRLSDNWAGEARVSYMDINTLSRQTLFPAGTILPIGNDGNIDFISPIQPVAFTDGVIGNPEIYEEHTRLDAVALYRGLQDHTWRIGPACITANSPPKRPRISAPALSMAA